MSELLRNRLLDRTRGRIVALLQSAGCTAEDIAAEIGLTQSAVRIQLAAMEREGVVRRAGKRPGTTRPSHVFELTTDVDQLLSKAYIPLLTQLVGVFAKALPADQMEGLLRETGRGLAAELSRGKRIPRSLRARAAMASRMLNEQLGATTRVEKNGAYVIRSSGCPLAALAGKTRGVCVAMESLVGAIVGVPVHECCEREERPRCCFKIPL